MTSTRRPRCVVVLFALRCAGDGGRGWRAVAGAGGSLLILPETYHRADALREGLDDVSAPRCIRGIRLSLLTASARSAYNIVRTYILKLEVLRMRDTYYTVLFSTTQYSTSH